MINKCLLIITTLLFSTSIFCQSTDRIFVEEGDKIFNFGDYEDAILFYQLAIEENPSNVRAHLMAGTCFLITTAEKKEAVHYLKKAHNLDSEVSTDILFKIGEGHRFRYEFEDAISYYNQYLQEIEDNSRAYEGLDIVALKKKTNKRINECENAKQLMSSPVPFKAENIGSTINSIDFDYAPTINLDESVLYFTSRREGTTGGFKDTDNKYFEDIWVTEKINGEWTQPVNLGAPINTNQHESNIGLSPDGNTLYIYHTENNGDIYYSEKEDGSWSEIEPMSKDVNTDYQETSINVSKNNSYMFFTSSRPGGQGQLDIYVIKRTKNRKWGKPENIGDVVNSEYNEDYPFFDQETSTLYFSSKGHNSMGGLDLFKAKWDTINNIWSEPINLGYPINSVDDDGFYVITGKTGQAYFASFNEDSYGYTDLYKIISDVVETEPEVVEVDVNDSLPEQLEVFETKLMVKAFDASTRLPLDSFEVEIQELGEKETSPKDLSNNTYLLSDTLEKEYVITVNSQGYLFQSKNYLFSAGKVDDEITLYLEARQVYVPKVLRNVYFKFDKSTLDENYASDLDQLVNMMVSESKMTLEVAGHTDFKGSEVYNTSLSQKRANSVKKYLVDKGIDSSRIIAKGYGEKYPLATNDDELEGRELNRRTEFIILSEQ